MTGRIKDLRERFGFIRDDETGLDFFVHCSDVVGPLEWPQLVVGDAVQFEAVDPTPARGRRAQQVAWQEGKRADG